MIDDDTVVVRIGSVSRGDFGIGCVNGYSWVSRSRDTPCAIPDPPVASAVSALYKEITRARSKPAVNRLAAAVAGVASDLADAGAGGEEVSHIR